MLCKILYEVESLDNSFSRFLFFISKYVKN
jgi:hypothetical protein